MFKISPISRFELDPPIARRLAALFTLFLFAFECVVLRPGYCEYIFWLSVNESPGFVGITLFLMAGSMCLVYFFFYSAFRASWKFRPFYLLVASFSLIAEYSYQKALGRFSEVIDVELAFATTFEQKYASVLMYLGYTAFFPLILFVLLLIFTKGKDTRGLRNLLIVNTLLVATVLVLSAFSISRFKTISTFAFYRTAIEFMFFGPVSQGKWGSDITGIKLLRLPVDRPPLPEGYTPDNNIVLVIDESVRGDHLSLNGYKRETTPFLDKLNSQGLLHNWGIAAAATTGSQPTFNALITGMSPDEFPDRGNLRLNSTPTLFQYAKAMRYKTWFIDGQMDSFWGGIPDDLNSIDRWTRAKDISEPGIFGKWKVDIEIARRVRETIGTSKGNFIVIFKYGSHIPYHHNYASDQGIWQPSYEPVNMYAIPGPEHFEAVVNSYDNSIRSNVNSFFENLVDDYANIPNNTSILYTGDHGQTLYANGKASHGGDTREEAAVPLFMIGRAGNGLDTRYKASHCNIFPTVTDLMNYPVELRPQARCLSLLKARAGDSKRRFFNKADLGEKIAFD